MLSVKYFFYLISVDFIVGRPQLNLYYNDEVSETNGTFQHTCLQHANNRFGSENEHQVISYCMNEFSSKFKIENNNHFPNFTFAELQKQNITSGNLYLWSAPIDIIERYQFYLNQLSTENDLSVSEEIYYNCTIPRFGPLCQYQLIYNYPDDSDLGWIIYRFYQDIPHEPSGLTCYTHLKCNRGPSPSCLDWSEICNGEIDCFDSGLDEKYCWQLEINECKDDEYQCANGQCIPKSFHTDHSFTPDCLDASDAMSMYGQTNMLCERFAEPSFSCDDVLCTTLFGLGSCVNVRLLTLNKIMHSNNESSLSAKCWSVAKCVLNFISKERISCRGLCERDECIKHVEDNCPDMLFFPNVPVLFGNVYLAYKTNQLRNWTNQLNKTILYML